jgi:hypothetical protein
LGHGSVTLSVTAIAVAAVAVLMAAAALWPGRAGQPPAAAVAANGQVRTFSVELGDLFVQPHEHESLDRLPRRRPGRCRR